MAHHHPGAGGKDIMKLQQASITDYASVLSFYNDVTEHTPEIERFARWQKGKHPTADGVRR